MIKVVQLNLYIQRKLKTRSDEKTVKNNRRDIVCLFATATIEADVPMSPGTFFQPTVVESAREMMWLYPSSATLVLPQLNVQEKQEIADLIQDKNRTYLTIKRDVSVVALQLETGRYEKNF